MKLATSVLLFAVVLSMPLSALAGAVDSRTWDGAGISARSGPFEPTLEAIQANVFTPSCALSFCHGAAMAATLDLRDGNSYASLVDIPSAELPTWDRVEPFDPETSFVICKLEDCPSIVGLQMPLIGGPLDQTVIDVIRDWILLGAPEFGNIAVEANTWGRVKSLYR